MHYREREHINVSGREQQIDERDRRDRANDMRTHNRHVCMCNTHKHKHTHTHTNTRSETHINNDDGDSQIGGEIETYR